MTASGPDHRVDAEVEAAVLSAALVRELVATGRLPSPRWREAFASVGRHWFVPQLYRHDIVDGFLAWTPLDASTQRHDWLRAVYTDEAWATQLDADERTPTSSTTAPWLMAEMLEALDLHDGHRVLEIGTGTGYNAALLCAVAGERNVTTVEVDSGLAHRARERLAARGYYPSVVTSDGAAGWPQGAPYDRLIATCATRRIPTSWLTQLEPNAVLVANLRGDIGGGILRLVRDPGAVVGHFLDLPGTFMHTRQNPTPDVFPRAQRIAAQATGFRTTAVTPDFLHDDGFAVLAQALLPGVVPARLLAWEDAPECFYLLAADGGSAAVVLDPSGGSCTVAESGPRHLWRDLETTYDEWQAAGRPTRSQLWITVMPGDQRLWAHRPFVGKSWPVDSW